MIEWCVYIYQDRYLRMDHWRHEVYASGQIIELTPIEWKILAELVKEPGITHSLEQMWSVVWGVDYPSLDLVKWHIKNLRKKLGFAVDGPIVTVRGVGHRYDPKGTLKESR